MYPEKGKKIRIKLSLLFITPKGSYNNTKPNHLNFHVSAVTPFRSKDRDHKFFFAKHILSILE